MTHSIPRLSWLSPPDWDVKESITLLHPEGIANVIFSSERVQDEVDSQEYARIQGELLRNEFPGFREIQVVTDFQMPGVGPGLKRIFSWLPPDSSPVTQIQLYAVGGGRGYTATATAPSDKFENLDAVFNAILNELSVES